MRSGDTLRLSVASCNGEDRGDGLSFDFEPGEAEGDGPFFEGDFVVGDGGEAGVGPVTRSLDTCEDKACIFGCKAVGDDGEAGRW